MAVLDIFKINRRLAESIEQLKSAHIDQSETLFTDYVNMRAAMILIRNQGITSTSGTAQSMARKAKAALK